MRVLAVFDLAPRPCQGLVRKGIKAPDGNRGMRVTTMNTCYKHWPEERERAHSLRRSSVFALSYRQHLARVFAVTLRSRLLVLLASNSGEGFPKIGIDASRIAKRLIEDRFHSLSQRRGCCIPILLSLVRARCVPGRGKPRWFSDLGRRLFS